MRRRYGHAESMSFGVLPSFAAFSAHIHSEDPDEGRPYLAPGAKYPMELTGDDQRVAVKLKLKPSGTGDYGKPRYELTAKQLYAAIKKMSAMFDSDMADEELREAAGSLASSIMGTLGYEWI